MRVGYCEDWFGAASEKVVIIDETISGKYLCKKCPIEMTRLDGSKYLADIPSSGLFLRDKNTITNIHEEVR